ncbi:MAG: hypothetical protein WAW61_01360 [Methylococcaceae bacterium]
MVALSALGGLQQLGDIAEFCLHPGINHEGASATSRHAGAS